MPRSLARASLRAPMLARERELVTRQNEEAQYGRGLLLLRVDEIQPNPRNARKMFDEASLNALADSIKQHGQLQPVVVRQVSGGYQLVAGERRWRAHSRAELDRIWAVERQVKDDFEACALGFIENGLRVPLSRVEKVAALDDLADLVGAVGLNKLAHELRIAPSWLSEQLKIRRDPDIAPSLVEGQVSFAQAAELARAPAHARRSLLDQTIRERPSFKQVREWVDDVKRKERAAKALIGAALARGETNGKPTELSQSGFGDVLVHLRSVGTPANAKDRQVVQEIADHCVHLLDDNDEPAHVAA